MPIQIDCVSTPVEQEQFIRLDWAVYQNNPCWTPPVIKNVRSFLTGKGRFFDHCAHRLWIARDGQKLVGKIAAFYDKNLTEHWCRETGCVGFFEALPDQGEAVGMLFQEAERFLRSQGVRTILGPINGSIMHPSGLLTHAYNRPSYFLMNYNPSYYHHYFRASGYAPGQELYAYNCDLMNGRLKRKVSFILSRAKRAEIEIAPLQMRRFREEIADLAKIYNETYRYHWSYSPQTEAEVRELLEPLKSLMDPEFVLIARHRGQAIGFFMALPDYSPVIREMGGDLEGFLNGLRFLRLRKKIKEARGIAVGVTKEWRGQNLAPLLLAHALQAMIRKGYLGLEYSWVHAEDASSQVVAKKFYGEIYKKYLIYQKELA